MRNRIKKFPVFANMKEVIAVKRFDGLLEENVSDYNGKLSEIIREAPAFYRLMVQLLDDPHLPKHLSQPVIAAIAYFILPTDAILKINLAQSDTLTIFFCVLLLLIA